MAFDASKLNQIISPLGDETVRFFGYATDDTETVVAGADYFTRAAKHGLRLHDIIVVSPLSGSYEPYILNIESISNAGHGTGVVGTAPSLNADKGLTLTNPTTFTQPVPITPFGGGTWYAANHLRGVITGTTPASRFTVGISMETTGDNANGPGLTAGPLWLHAQKKDFTTSTEPGEVDALYMIANQGQYGDVGGILISAYKQTGGTGGLTGIEISANRISGSALNKQQSLTTITGYLTTDAGFEGSSGARGHGFYAEPRGGQQVYSAFTAMEGTDFSATLDGTPTAGSLLYYITGHSSRSLSNLRYYVSTAGKMFLRAATALDHLDLRTAYAGTDPSGIRLQKTGASTSGQALHYLLSFAPNAGGTEKQYGAFYTEIVDNTAGSEDGRWAFNTIVAGSNAFRLYIGAGVYTAGVTGGDKGAGTINAGTIYQNNVPVVASSGTTGGSGSGGAGNQYVVLTINGTNYKMLHDGTV